jgi:hypothetical protein
MRSELTMNRNRPYTDSLLSFQYTPKIPCAQLANTWMTAATAVVTAWDMMLDVSVKGTRLDKGDRPQANNAPVHEWMRG